MAYVAHGPKRASRGAGQFSERRAWSHARQGQRSTAEARRTASRGCGEPTGTRWTRAGARLLNKSAGSYSADKAGDQSPRGLVWSRVGDWSGAHGAGVKKGGGPAHRLLHSPKIVAGSLMVGRCSRSAASTTTPVVGQGRDRTHGIAHPVKPILQIWRNAPPPSQPIPDGCRSHGEPPGQLSRRPTHSAQRLAEFVSGHLPVLVCRGPIVMQPYVTGPQLPVRAADPGGRSNEGHPSCFSTSQLNDPSCATPKVAVSAVAAPITTAPAVTAQPVVSPTLAMPQPHSTAAFPPPQEVP